eukprot:scaffold17913_cov112-Isochrysis_galbana.AAC.3
MERPLDIHIGSVRLPIFSPVGRFAAADHAPGRAPLPSTDHSGAVGHCQLRSRLGLGVQRPGPRPRPAARLFKSNTPGGHDGAVGQRRRRCRLNHLGTSWRARPTVAPCLAVRSANRCVGSDPRSLPGLPCAGSYHPHLTFIVNAAACSSVRVVFGGEPHGRPRCTVLTPPPSWPATELPSART